MKHELKIWPEYYDAVADWSKPFEYRTTDRPFSVGDTLILRDYDPATQDYTGRPALVREISYILTGGEAMEILGFKNEWKVAADGLAEALDWTIEYMLDGKDTTETPEHPCDYYHNPEAGMCHFCEKFCDCGEALSAYRKTKVSA